MLAIFQPPFLQWQPCVLSLWLLPCWLPCYIIWNQEECQESCVSVSASSLYQLSSPELCIPLKNSFLRPYHNTHSFTTISLGMVKTKSHRAFDPHSCQPSPETLASQFIPDFWDSHQMYLYMSFVLTSLLPLLNSKIFWNLVIHY